MPRLRARLCSKREKSSMRWAFQVSRITRVWSSAWWSSAMRTPASSMDQEPSVRRAARSMCSRAIWSIRCVSISSATNWKRSAACFPEQGRPSLRARRSRSFPCANFLSLRAVSLRRVRGWCRSRAPRRSIATCSMRSNRPRYSRRRRSCPMCPKCLIP
ncbi:unknown [Eggerthella sp. CAG:298]|nr:unknown [Eggerthella sp. CAG:298]